MKAMIKKDNKYADGEEVQLEADPIFKVQGAGKVDNDINVHSWITGRLSYATKMGGWGSGGHSVSFHTSSLGKTGSGCQRESSLANYNQVGFWADGRQGIEAAGGKMK